MLYSAIVFIVSVSISTSHVVFKINYYTEHGKFKFSSFKDAIECFIIETKNCKNCLLGKLERRMDSQVMI